MDNDLRVWNVINPPADPFYHLVKSPKEAAVIIKKLANEQLKDNTISSNAFGLEVQDENGEWFEWYDDFGDDIDEWAKNMKG